MAQYITSLCIQVQAHGLGVAIPLIAGDVARVTVRKWKNRSRKRQQLSGWELDLGRQHFFKKLTRAYRRWC